MSSWQPGDLALCVNDTASPVWGLSELIKGRVYTITRVVGVFDNALFGPGLSLQVAEAGCSSPSGHHENRFRKIRPHTPDAEDAETIRLLNGEPAQVTP